MLDKDSLYQVFKDRVGFKDALLPSYQTLDTSITSSESGLFVNDVSLAFLKSEDIFGFIFDFNSQKYPTYSGSGFLAGQKYLYNGVAYIALDSGNNEDPDTAPEKWFDLASWFLQENVLKPAIFESINEVLKENNAKKHIKDLINTDILWKERQFKKIQSNSGRFIGLKIVPCMGQGITQQFKQIGFNYDTAETIKFYLYHTSQEQPIQEIDIEVTEPNKFVWYDIDITLDYVSQNYNTGGVFYLGYDESTLGGQFYSNENGGVYYYNLNKKLIWKYYSISFNSSQLNTPNIPNVGDYFDNNNEEDFNTFNLKVNSLVDYTELMTRNISEFDLLIQYKSAIKLLELLRNSTRINRTTGTKQIDTSSLAFELYGQRVGANGGIEKKGIIQEYNDFKKQVKINYDSIDYVFMPQNGLRLIG